MKNLQKFAILVGWMFLVWLSCSAVAGPGDGINVGEWVFSPYLELNFTYDSNVYRDPTNKIDDTFFEPELGLKFSSSTETNVLMFEGSVFISDRQYNTQQNRDFTSYGDSLAFQLGNGRKFLIELLQSYRHLDDNDRHAADLASSRMGGEMIEESTTLDLERDLNQLGLSLDRRVTDKIRLLGYYRYTGVHYPNKTHHRLEPKKYLYVPEGLDLDTHIVELEGAWGGTDRTDVYLSVSKGWQYQEKTADPAEFVNLTLGLESREISKIEYDLGVGLEYYARPNQVIFEESTGATKEVRFTPEGVKIENEQITFSANASVDWYMTEKTTFRLGLINGTDLSAFYENNGTEFLSGWMGIGYRWSKHWIFAVRGVIRQDAYIDPVTHLGETKDRTDLRVEGHARVDYIAPRNFLRFFAKLVYDEVWSNFDFVEYDEQRIILGAILQY